MIVRGSAAAVELTSHGTPKRVLLRGGALPDVTQVAVAEFDEHGEVESHAHPTMYEIYYVLDGAAAYRVGEDVYEAGPGDLVTVPPATRHGLKVTRAPHRVFYWGIKC
jgi:quercetin dioxygenase-like cupin family protein